MGRVTSSACQGWGGFGSLSWHETWIHSFESVDAIEDYLKQLNIPFACSTDLKDCKQTAIELVEKQHGITTLRGN